MSVHPTAIVDPGAELAADVTLGPYVVVGPGVSVGAGTTVGSHSCLEGPMRLGAGCTVGKHVALGSAPQDMGYQGDPTRLEMGDENWVGDGVTISRGTPKGGGVTRIGRGNFFMAYSHVGHDCLVGDGVVMANNALLAGHCEVEDRANLAGQVAIHQFVRIGRMAMVQGASGVAQDIPPFSWVGGCRARIQNVNRVGLQRSGMAAEEIRAVRAAFKTLFRDGTPFAQALEALQAAGPHPDAVMHLIAFCQGSRRGLLRWR